MLSFFLYIFFFASLEHFTNAKTEAVPNDFSPQVIFCLGECIYLIFIGTWNPSRYFLESEEIWDSFILCDSEESFSGCCSNTDEKCQIDKFVFVAFSGKDNWMGCKSRHFSASEILSITYFQKRLTMTQKCDLQEISQHVTVKCIYTFFFSNNKCQRAQMTLWINLSMNQDLICIYFPQINRF